MPKVLTKGTKVEWSHGKGHGHGVIMEHYKDDVHKVLQGSKITRNGTPDNPAYLIEQENGHQVLKLQSELTTE